jgi:hypothetical protein
VANTFGIQSPLTAFTGDQSSAFGQKVIGATGQQQYNKVVGAPATQGPTLPTGDAISSLSAYWANRAGETVGQNSTGFGNIAPEFKKGGKVKKVARKNIGGKKAQVRGNKVQKAGIVSAKRGDVVLNAHHTKMMEGLAKGLAKR